MKLTGLAPSSFLEIPNLTCIFHEIGEKQQTRRDFGSKTTQHLLLLTPRQMVTTLNFHRNYCPQQCEILPGGIFYLKIFMY